MLGFVFIFKMAGFKLERASSAEDWDRYSANVRIHFFSLLNDFTGNRVGFACMAMVTVIVATGTDRFLSCVGSKGLAYE